MPAPPESGFTIFRFPISKQVSRRRNLSLPVCLSRIAPSLALVALAGVLCAWGQSWAGPSVLPLRIHQDDDEQLPPFTGLIGTSIGDVVWSGRYLWVATERGVSRLDPSQASGLDAGDWATFRRIFAAHMETEAATEALAQAAEIAAAGPVCLMCYERAPETCHRAIVADRLADMMGKDVRHLTPDVD